jgi:RsiW-degrading membrane proteinase PrsW (M82 family)
MPTTEVALYAFVGGILPTLVWLHFLLKEDARCPEPRTLIVLAMFAGMLAVPIVLPLEHYVKAIMPTITAIPTLFDRFALDLAIEMPVIIAWAVIEETVKFALAALLILWRRQVDEPTDLIIYMICVALGFSALENALFLVAPLANGDVMQTVLANNLRFIGATLLHVIASSTVGFAMALAYTKRHHVRAAAATIGLILAIALHALFNFLIIRETAADTVLAFLLVWVGAVVGFGLFELLRYARYRRLPTNTC